MTTAPRICVLGNSHLVSVREAILADNEFSTLFRSDFFGAPGQRLNALELQGRSLVPATNHLKSWMRRIWEHNVCVDIDQYDCFVIVGCGLQPRLLLSQGHRHGTCEHQRWGATAQLISTAAWKRTESELFNTTVNMKLTRAIRQVSAAPILAVSGPGPSVEILQQPDWASMKKRELSYFHAIEDSYRKGAEAAVANLNVHLIFQPQSTITHGIFTEAHFKGTSGFQDGVVLGDLLHMNAAYGAIMLKSIRERLTALFEPPARIAQQDAA